jgi:hypothetical protein
MTFKPRLRLPRRQPTVHLQCADQEFSVWCPQPDLVPSVAEFGDAVALAIEVSSMPLQREALVLLDERRRITAILLDPPAEIGVWVGRWSGPGLETPFSSTLCVVIRDRVHGGPPHDDDRRAYQALRRIHMAQGLLLLDALVTDGDRVQSLAIGCDPDPVWFDEFTPLDPAA